ncbi:hypothetical protein ACFS7Z_07325 [Pontibacter toksunensis]|uniref:Lipoprotein n=1 Tax=Pontibacter toksunensis TaxID=1332631 RepID=A0ABW6BRL5_9BACT
MMAYFCRRVLFLFLPLLGGVVLFGCDGDDAPDPVVANSSGMSAVVNGVDWKASNGNFKLGSRTITEGTSAFVGTGDTLTIVGVQVQGTDTSAIILSVKLKPKKIGSYRLRSGGTGEGIAYFLPDGIAANALKETKGNYNGGIINGELQIAAYDSINYNVSGNFGFSMSAPGETTYTIIAGKIENVTF